MPIRISDLARERREIRVPTNHGDLRVVYNPNAVTASDQARLLAAEGTEAFRELLGQIEKTIVFMDLVGPLYDDAGQEIVPDGEPIPVEGYFLQFLPQMQLAAIYQAVLEDSRPKATNSSKGSGRLYEATGSFS